MKKILGVFLFFVFASADAALIDRGGGFIYDDVLDITWTQDANINGVADSWDNQVAWAAGLSIFDSVRNVTWSDWRLPNMDVNGDNIIVYCSTLEGAPAVSEQACRDNELGYLVHQNGVNWGAPGLFTNIQPNQYWSGTENATALTNAHFIYIVNGFQSNANKALQSYNAWAVMDGNVVPVPAAVWLFGSALGLLGWMGRRTE